MKYRLAPRRVTGTMTPDMVLRPVFALDIDGTLGYYHEHFIDYAERFLQKTFQPWWDGEEPFWRMFGVSKTTYREMKLGYRQGRQKRSMPVIPGAADLAREIRKAGAEVWVCTTRPYLRLDNIDPDTRWWLKHNGIQYDGVLFGEWKYRDLAQIVGAERVLGVLDDDPAQVRNAALVDLPGNLINREYNQTETPGLFNKGRRIDHLETARRQFVEACSEWREFHHV